MASGMCRPNRVGNVGVSGIDKGAVVERSGRCTEFITTTKWIKRKAIAQMDTLRRLSTRDHMARCSVKGGSCSWVS